MTVTKLPFTLILSIFILILSAIGFLYDIPCTLITLSVAVIITIFNITLWVLNLSVEYIKKFRIDENEEYFFKKGFFIFIITEILFFTSFFWAYYNTLLDPNIYIGGIWPPIYDILSDKIALHTDTGHIFMNTLLTSLILVITINSAHTNSPENRITLLLTIFFFGSYFAALHILELFNMNLNIYDGILSSNFHVITGLHSMHVLIGIYMVVIIVFFNLHNINYKKLSYSEYYNFMFYKNSTFVYSLYYYWHLIDIIWILVFITQYIYYNQLNYTLFNIFITDNIL